MCCNIQHENDISYKEPKISAIDLNTRVWFWLLPSEMPTKMPIGESMMLMTGATMGVSMRRSQNRFLVFRPIIDEHKLPTTRIPNKVRNK